MLISLSQLQGYNLVAKDGPVGKVTDLFFDQENWRVRYVADKTSRLWGKEVLLSIGAVEKTDWKEQQVLVGLAKDKVKDSPRVNLKSMITKKDERLLSDHYGWAIPAAGLNSPTSLSTSAGANTGAGILVGSQLAGFGDENKRKIAQDKNSAGYLQSTHMVLGFKISTNNGDLGTVEDFIVDEADWSIRFMVIDTKGSHGKKKILLAPEWIDWISWRERHVLVNMEKEKIQGCPNFDLSFPLKQEYADILYDRYECKQHWA